MEKVTDYNFILSRIEELAQQYQIKEIAFDRFGLLPSSQRFKS